MPETYSCHLDCDGVLEDGSPCTVAVDVTVGLTEGTAVPPAPLPEGWARVDGLMRVGHPEAGDNTQPLGLLFHSRECLGRYYAGPVQLWLDQSGAGTG